MDRGAKLRQLLSVCSVPFFEHFHDKNLQKAQAGSFSGMNAGNGRFAAGLRACCYDFIRCLPYRQGYHRKGFAGFTRHS